MKKYLLLIFTLSIVIGAQAQIDTILFEDFQQNVFVLMDDEPTGSNVTWVNYDEDGLPSILGTEGSQKWIGSEALTNSPDSEGVTNFVALSYSYLENFLPGNRNWLILPPMEITDENYILHWLSSPSQLPRFMDGYQVFISTTSNDITSFTDTLFTAASMDEVIGDSQSTDYSNFTFTPGYLHADGATNPDYFIEGATVHSGVLEPHSVDLSEYAGETVYICFLHDSDDDDRMQLDNILITTGEGPSSVSESTIENFRIETYPNPVNQFMNLAFSLESKGKTSYSIFDTQGKLVQQIDLGELITGTHIERINLVNFPSGNYHIQLSVNGEVVSRSFVKR